MKKIDYYSTRFTAGENNVLGDEIVVVTGNAEEIDINIYNFGLNIDGKNSLLTDAIKTSRKNPVTEQLNYLEEKRISHYVGGKGLARAYSNWDIDEDKKKAGIALTEIFTRHGNVSSNLSHQDQHSIIGSFIKETGEQELQANYATLGMTEWYSSLTNLQINYKEAFSEKESYESNKESVSKIAAQTPLIDSIKDLIYYLNGMVSLNSNNEQWMKVYNDISGIINRVYINSKIRRANSKSNEEEEE